MCLRVVILLSFCSILTGIFWVFFARVYKRNLPFRLTGLLSGVWFIPALLAATTLSQRMAPVTLSGAPCSWLGGIFICECLAAFISGLWGPLSWLSFHFGFAQGLVGELIYHFVPKPGAVAIGLLVTDLVLMRIHPQLKHLRVHRPREWILHILGACVSTFVVLEVIGKVAQTLLGSLLRVY